MGGLLKEFLPYAKAHLQVRPFYSWNTPNYSIQCFRAIT